MENEKNEITEDTRNFFERGEIDPIFPEKVIRERTINDAWRSAMWCCIRNGYRYEIKQGSYEGQERLQMENAMVIIEEPWTRPLAVFMPEGLGFTAPTSEERINDYFMEYLASGEKEEGEDYTYGQFIVEQLPRTIDLLVQSGGKTNQACIAIGNEHSTYLNDPPCLRSISFQAIPQQSGIDKLQMSLYFRSWDLFAGFPENLGGLQLLKEFVIIELEHKGLKLEDGPITAFSNGLHIYDHFYPLANQLNADRIDLKKTEDFNFANKNHENFNNL